MPERDRVKEVLNSAVAICLAATALAPYLAAVSGRYSPAEPLEPEQLILMTVFTSLMGWGAVKISRRDPSPTAGPAGPRMLRRVGLVLGGLALGVSGTMFILFLAMASAMQG